jgi:hypothetical protein
MKHYLTELVFMELSNKIKTTKVKLFTKLQTVLSYFYL